MLNSTQTLTCNLLGGSSWDLLKLETPKKIKKRDEEDDGKDEVPLHALVKPPIHHSMKTNWKKEEEEKERERKIGWKIREWTYLSSSLSK